MSDYWNPVNIKTTKVYGQVCKVVPVGVERDHCVGIVIKAFNRARTGWSAGEQEEASIGSAFCWAPMQCAYNLPKRFFHRIYLGENPYV